MFRSCVNGCNIFSHSFGELALKSQKHYLPLVVKKAFEIYFGCKQINQNKPEICCACMQGI